MTIRPKLKRQIEHVLRRAGLEAAIYHYVGLKNRLRFAASDRAFFAAHPGLVLPPPHLRFDVLGCSSAEYYASTGTQMAEQLLAVLRHWVATPAPTVCEWGCGPGRILFAFEKLDAAGAMRLMGFDAFAPSIAWAESVPGSRIRFHRNNMAPPLAVPADAVDFAYAVSVFTHLSERLSRLWFREIMRILKPGGIFWFSTKSGQSHLEELTPAQREQLARGEFVAIHSVNIGSQMYAGIHCPALMKEIIASAGAELLDHQPGGHQQSQDAWIVRKA